MWKKVLLLAQVKLLIFVAYIPICSPPNKISHRFTKDSYLELFKLNVCQFVQWFSCTYICIYIYIHIYIYMYIQYMYEYMYVHIYICSPFLCQADTVPGGSCNRWFEAFVPSQETSWKRPRPQKHWFVDPDFMARPVIHGTSYQLLCMKHGPFNSLEQLPINHFSRGKPIRISGHSMLDP